MADWFTPIQRLKAKETTWMKLEKSNKPLEEISRRVPLVTSHLYGHWLQDIEGRPLGNHKKVENKSDYRRTGLPLDKTIGLPKSTNELFLE